MGWTIRRLALMNLREEEEEEETACERGCAGFLCFHCISADIHRYVTFPPALSDLLDAKNIPKSQEMGGGGCRFVGLPMTRFSS